ncbi:MAG: hypothetical protein FWC41_12005 [Firmicutes bacterium]|nr:hypothetical protein [Bacillota bacterium]
MSSSKCKIKSFSKCLGNYYIHYIDEYNNEYTKSVSHSEWNKAKGLKSTTHK